ncbi:transcriptional adapter ADA2b isoform X1 [Nicotiana tomentosiformis]|uniref:transcriptional adapter ADA2b isoform X1 n=2 Tax=Nicotiana tomentosiformis TaxID=4098 RepID=UPI000878555A|nr:transcriptional adapter ADA2b isoform X1 [Nicotiana tomentosiformis]
MGRSRGNFQADEDPSQRSRRKKNASSGENLESVTVGQGTGEGKRALYHCNYCNKDISGRIRIKCGVCSDFDLCIECFSVGAEVQPHKSHHPYRVMDILSFPLIRPDWNADEEMLLLEGLEMYGMGNWAEVGEHVGTKTKEACVEHFKSAYLESPYFPLPDMTHVIGKNRKELLAMAKGNFTDKKGLSSLGEVVPKDESFSPSRVKVEDSHKNGPLGRLNSISNADKTGTTGIKKPSSKAQAKDQNVPVKLEDNHSGRNFGGKKPKSLKDDGSSLMKLSGYNPKRQEFDPEYDNDAEQLLADMEFKETETEEERELKLRVLRIYGKRLDERKRRKDFILERNLLQPSEFEKDLSPEERDICRHYDAIMRFLSKEEHEELLKTVVSEHRFLKRIQELKLCKVKIMQEARAAGCRSSAEVERYIERKRKREVEEGVPRKESSQIGPTSQEICQGNLSSITDSGIAAFSAGELLSEPEKQLCREIRLPPQHYLRMQEVLTIQIFSGNITRKSDAYPFFQIEATKVDRVYDMLLKKGVAPL